jgi:hypothetical protein
MNYTDAAKQELKRNNFTLLTTPLYPLKIQRPIPALLLKYGIAPNFLYGAVAMKISEGFYNPEKDSEDITDKLLKVICELILEPRFEPEDIILLGAKEQGGIETRQLMILLATGKLEEITSEDLMEYAIKGGLEHDAISFNYPVSSRLGIGGTLTGYDLDMAAGLYIQKHHNDVLKLKLGIQANTAGYNLINGR